MMSQLSVIWGAARYEYRMQIRRVSVWVVLGLISLVVFGIWYGQSDLLYGFYTRPELHQPSHFVPPDPRMSVLFWTRLMAMFLPLGVGLVLADRLARDARLRVDELFYTVQGSPSGRLTGKFLGGTLATLTPVFLIYFGVVIYMVQQTGTLSVLPLALALFAAVILPGSLFVSGFSIAFPAILRVPVYQFLFTGYWFWANLLSPRVGIPSIVGTMLNAAGPWAQEGIFKFQWAFLTLHATPLEGFLSIALLSGLGLAATLGMVGYLHWRALGR
jgi:ABC-2 type transport system permease protein